MNHFKEMMAEMSVLLSYPKHFIVLGVRLMLAYGFSTPALVKINDIKATREWFTQIEIPFPYFFTYVVSGLETLGIVLLILGLFTRFITLFLACIMIGAVIFVHLPNGFSVSNNGFEIPLYYFLFLMILATYGAGKFSLDNLFFKDK